MITVPPFSGMIGPAAGGGGSDPGGISGLLFWFKADAGVFSDAGSTAANNGDTVQQWNDQSGNAIHASQATSGSRPTYRTNQINGLPAIDFATSKWMSFTEQTTADFTLFVVVKQGSASAKKSVIGGTDNTTKIHLQFQNGAGGGGYNLLNVQRTVTSSEEEPIDFIQACVRSTAGGGGSTTLRVDGVPTGGDGGGAGASFGISHLATWVNSGTPTDFLNGLIAEVILYNVALSDGDINLVENSLRDKYDLPNPADVLTDPTTITGCKLWLKADVLVLSDGDPVATWPDSSGLGNDATQATSGNRPTFQTNEINTSLPVVRFDGGDWMQVPSFTIGSLLVVHKYRTSGNYPDFKTPFNDRTPSEGRVFLLNSGSTNLYPSNVLMVNRHFRNGIKTNSLAPIDSYQISFGSWPGNTLTDAYDVGRDDQNNSRAWDGDVVEVIAYDRGISPAHRKRLEAYAGSKYAITV